MRFDINDKIYEIAYKTGMCCDGTPDAWDDRAIYDFAMAIIAECVSAVAETDTTDALTTHELDYIRATLIKAGRSIERKFSGIN